MKLLLLICALCLLACGKVEYDPETFLDGTVLEANREPARTEYSPQWYTDADGHMQLRSDWDYIPEKFTVILATSNDKHIITGALGKVLWHKLSKGDKCQVRVRDEYLVKTKDGQTAKSFVRREILDAVKEAAFAETK